MNYYRGKIIKRVNLLKAYKAFNDGYYVLLVPLKEHINQFNPIIIRKSYNLSSFKGVLKDVFFVFGELKFYITK